MSVGRSEGEDWLDEAIEGNIIEEDNSDGCVVGVDDLFVELRIMIPLFRRSPNGWTVEVLKVMSWIPVFASKFL